MSRRPLPSSTTTDGGGQSESKRDSSLDSSRSILHVLKNVDPTMDPTTQTDRTARHLRDWLEVYGTHGATDC